jgi:hypothetical protein
MSIHIANTTSNPETKHEPNSRRSHPWLRSSNSNIVGQWNLPGEGFNIIIKSFSLGCVYGGLLPNWDGFSDSGAGISRPEILSECAHAIGINQEQFLLQLNSGAGQSGFTQDLEKTRESLIMGFPTVVIGGPNNKGITLRGAQSFENLESRFLKLTSLSRSRKSVDINLVLTSYTSGTTREFSEILERPLKDTAELLTQAGASRHSIAGDAIWKATKLLQ